MSKARKTSSSTSTTPVSDPFRTLVANGLRPSIQLEIHLDDPAGVHIRTRWRDGISLG